MLIGTPSATVIGTHTCSDIRFGETNTKENESNSTSEMNKTGEKNINSSTSSKVSRNEGMKNMSGTQGTTGDTTSDVIVQTDKESPKTLTTTLYKYTDSKKHMSCKNTQTKGTDYTFCMEISEKEEQHIKHTEDSFLNAAEYVQILDQIPLEKGQVDDEELEYYDSLIKN